jgi:hypothetical protein
VRIAPNQADSAQPEKLLTLSDARTIASDKVKIENCPYVIWWVMDRGYVILPQGLRPKWFFASEEELVLPRFGD